MKNYILIFCLIILNISKFSVSLDEQLEEVGEEELQTLVKDEKYILVLFMKGKIMSGCCLSDWCYRYLI